MKPMNIINRLIKRSNLFESNEFKNWSDHDYELIMIRLELSPSDTSGGIIRFRDVDIDAIIDLVAVDLIDENDRQNQGPSIKEIIDFYKQGSESGYVDNFKVEGYVVDKSRSDRRVTVDGVSFDFLSSWIPYVEDLVEYADEKTVDEKNGHCEAWWD